MAVKDGGNSYIRLANTGALFNTLRITASAPKAGNYIVSFDIKRAGSAFVSTNFGYSLQNSGIANFDILRVAIGATQGNPWDYNYAVGRFADMDNGWVRYNQIVAMNASQAAGLTNISFWYDTGSVTPEVSALLIDNISIKKVLDASDFEPELQVQNTSLIVAITKVSM